MAAEASLPRACRVCGRSMIEQSDVTTGEPKYYWCNVAKCSEVGKLVPA